MKETLKDSVYKYIRLLSKNEHLLLNTLTGKMEIFFANKNHASWGIIWKNTHLEFASSIK